MSVSTAVPADYNPPKLLDHAASVKQMNINWGVYSKDALIINDAELALITAFDKSPKTAQLAAVSEKGVEHVQMFLKLVTNLSKNETLQYVLTLIDDLFTDEPGMVKLFLTDDVQKEKQSYEPFLDILRRSQDQYLVHMTCRVVSILVQAGAALDEESSRFYFEWIRDQYKSKGEVALLALNALSKILQRDENRLPFLQTPHCISELRSLLKSENTMQLKYQATLCLWVLLFNPVVVARLDTESKHLIAALCTTLREANKEKLARVCIACLRNLLEKAEDEKLSLQHANIMITNKLLVEVRKFDEQKTYPDEELQEDAEYLHEQLAECFEHMSSYEMYKAEIVSGNLQWSPVHRSERFWRENAIHLNEDKHLLVKYLVEQLQSTDPTVLAVASHDCGQYVRYYPRGRSLIEDLGGKTLIMGNLQHEDGVVRFESLIALQKLMTDNWEFLGKQASAGSK